VLHPRHKLAYFKTAGWKKDWIKTAKKIVCDRYESHYNKDSVRSDVGGSDLEEQQVRNLVHVFVFLVSLTGALGSAVFDKCFQKTSIARPPQIWCRGRRAQPLPQY
jgi:hypothetical protein